GSLQVTVQKDEDHPLQGFKVHLFSASGTYLGRNAVTDTSGRVAFSVPEGAYKLRLDYLGYQFWSTEIYVTEDTAIEMTIPHMQVEIAVQGLFQGIPTPIEGIKVYLFGSTGAYLGQYQLTDAEGQAIFDLPQKDYKVRADYMGRQFWSEVFVWENTPVHVPLADAEVTVTGAGLPRQDVKMYLFSVAGTYLGRSEATDVDGKVLWRLPAGAYKFRVDYQSSQYWSVAQTLTADQVNPVIVSVGGGSFAFTVLGSGAEPLVGLKCYVFSAGGSYLGLRGVTNSHGQAFFDLAEGAYRFRMDHLGYQFWSPEYQVPAMLTGAFDLPHQDVVLTVQGFYQTGEPLAGLQAYLFSPAGSYLGQNRVTDAYGQVAFNLPLQPFKVRVDYLGQQFWSEDFQSRDTMVTIYQGLAEIQAWRASGEVAGVKVYLFSEDGSYLGWNETTDASGHAEFILPEHAFKFRLDQNGKQYWTPVVQIRAGEVNAVAVDLDQ
ncbi:MAG: carboxypeptidase regulatory-like domain-containing protein, partial [Desulfobacterales bacterium]